MNSAKVKGESCRLEYLHNGSIFDDGEQHESEISQRGRFRYEEVPAESREFVKKLFWGKIEPDELLPPDPTTVRMYLCSGTTDMEAERNAIHTEVVPLLRDYCRIVYGMEFHLVDPKWGIPESDLNDPWIRDACLAELDRCIEESVGPSFAIAIGVKNGPRLPPSEVPEDIFQVIRALLEEEENDVTVLDKWYLKNSNCTPNVYMLQRFHGSEHQTPESWRDYAEELVRLIDKGSSIAVGRLMLTKQEATNLTESLLSAELSRGFEKLHSLGRDTTHHCVGIVRTLRGVKDNLLSGDVGKYIDENSSSGKIDSMAFLEALKWCTERIPKAFGSKDNLKITSVLWKDLKTRNEEELNRHMSEICGFFYETVRGLIQRFAEEKESRAKDELVVEVNEQWSNVYRVCDVTLSRNEILAVVRGYLGSVETDQPLILIGQSGVGKTVLAAQIARSIQTLSSKLFPGLQNSVVVRFLGSTSASVTLQRFLFNMCQQLLFVMDRPLKDIPKDCSKLKRLFFELVTKAEFSGIMVLIIDGLESLSAENGKLDLDWLPSRIVNNLKVIITVRQESQEALQKLVSKIEPGNMLKIGPMGPENSSEIIKAWMNGEERTIIIDQWKCVLETIRHGATPLFLKILFRRLLSLKSSDHVDSLLLHKTGEATMDSFFPHLEEKHDRLIFHKVLAYLTATKDGLTEMELIDIMSMDEEILYHLGINCDTLPRRFPGFYLYHIRQDLQPFLVAVQVDGVTVLRWANKEFHDSAQMRYLHDVNFRSAVFSTMAKYFQGPCAGKNRTSDLECQDHIQDKDGRKLNLQVTPTALPTQPIMLSAGELRVRFNLRKLRFLPRCLASAGLFDVLKRDVLCNFEWIRARLAGSSVDDLFEDFGIFEDKETKFVVDAIRMSVESLAVDSNVLGVEITGRLLPQSSLYPHIRALIRQCDLAVQTYCPLVPNYQVYSSPGGPMHSECAIVDPPGVGGQGQITCFRSPEGLLAAYTHSANRRLIIWNLSLQKEVKGLHVPPGVVYPSQSGQDICVVNGNNVATVYKTSSGEQQCEMKCDQEMTEFVVGNRYFGFTSPRGTGPTIVEMDTGSVVHKLWYHCRTLAISLEDDYLLCNSQSTIFLYTLPFMERKLVIQANDIPVQMKFFNSFRKFLVLSKDFNLIQYTYDPLFKSYSSIKLLRDLGILEFVFSALEDMVLVRSSYCLWVIETTGGKILHTLDDFPRGVFLDHTTHFTGAGFSPDSRVVIASRYTYICVWCARSGQPLRILLSAASPIERMFVANSLYMAMSLQQNGKVQVWDLNRLDVNIKLSNAVLSSPVGSLELSVKSRMILCFGENEPEAKLVDLNSGEIKTTLQHGDGNTNLCEVALSPNGKFALTCSIQDEMHDVSSIHSHMDTGDEDTSNLREAILWECTTGRKVYHALNNTDVVFSNDSNFVSLITRISLGKFEFSGYNTYAAVTLSLTTGKEHYSELPTLAQFVCKPLLLLNPSGKEPAACLVSVMQISHRSQIGSSPVSGLESVSDIRVVVSRLGDDEEGYSLLGIQNLCKLADARDLIIDARLMPCEYILFTYCRGYHQFYLGQDGRVILPNDLQKGAFVFDFQKERVLQHFPNFLETTSILEYTKFSQSFHVVLDNRLNIFNLSTGQKIKSSVFNLDPDHTSLALDGRYIIGLTVNRREIVVIRSADGVVKGRVFIHGRGAALSVGEDGRTVAVGCDDGRVMVFTLILELCDPVIECIDKLPSRQIRDIETNLLKKDVRRISSSSSELSRLSARIRQNRLTNQQRPPSYKMLSNAAEVVKNYNRQLNSQVCSIQ